MVAVVQDPYEELCRQSFQGGRFLPFHPQGYKYCGFGCSSRMCVKTLEGEEAIGLNMVKLFELRRNWGPYV